MIGLVLVALGRWMFTRARTIADITIDVEASHPASSETGSEESRQIEAGCNTIIGYFVVALGSLFGMISAVQLLSRNF